MENNTHFVITIKSKHPLAQAMQNRFKFQANKDKETKSIFCFT